ncbi:MAG: hypothetical protein IH857_01580 [Deltaproteobacteria bacterium]|nr:hypothetical protein [Deltaproteobacteria bacterium]
MSQLSIVDVAGQYTELKRTGQEWKGLCPFHSEKTPSFFVNEEKAVFYCYGCLEGGDVIAFIEKIEGLGFKDALTRLGVEEPPRRSREDQAARDEAKEIVGWASRVSEQIGEKLRAIGQTQRLLAEFTDRDLANWELKSLRRQWTLLTVIDDDLADPVSMVELYENREIIEGLLTL